MSTFNSYPNFNAWLDNAWGSGYAYESACGFRFATGLVFGVNPPYYLDDFLATYPKFFGPSSNFVGNTTIGSAQITNILSTAGMKRGQFVQCGAFPFGCVILSVDSSSVITLTQNAMATVSGAAFDAYLAPPIPTFVLLQYLNLAAASLVEAQWQEQWYLAMGWFIAHYTTIYARTDSESVLSVISSQVYGEVPAGNKPGTVFTLSTTPTNGVLEALYKNGVFQTPGMDYTLSDLTITMAASVGTLDTLYATWNKTVITQQDAVLTPAQIAAKGVAEGILTSKSVGDVSASYQTLATLEIWAAWNLTTYGQLLTTAAKVIGSGPLLIW